MAIDGRYRWAAVLVLVLGASACRGGSGNDSESPTSAPATPAQEVQETRSVAESRQPPDPTPTQPTSNGLEPASRGQILEALGWLEAQVRPAAGSPDNPWALGHGILAFGKDFKTRDGKSAVARILATAVAEGPEEQRRYRFPKTAPDATPIEPHPYALTTVMLAAGVPPEQSHPSADGTPVTLARLLTDMREAPTDDSAPTEASGQDHRWHSVAWRLSALALEPDRVGPAYSRLRSLALTRLEADLQPFATATPDASAFDATAPMGAAKRAKSHIYGHSCGGLHFIDAVVRSHPAADDPATARRVTAVLRSLDVRFEAERALYSSLNVKLPNIVMVLTVQQLKFFGHVLEVLGHAHAMGYRDQVLASLETRVAAEVVRAVAKLRDLGAYENLETIRQQRVQTYLDLIGDGCHAVAALRDLLQRMPK